MLIPGAFPILDFDDDPDDLISPMMFADVQVEGPGVGSTAPLATTWMLTAFSNPPKCCAANCKPCWPAAPRRKS